MEQKKRIRGHSHHEGRDDLAGEASYGDGGQLICLVIFLIVWIGDSFFLKISTFLNSYVAFYVKIPIALIFFACGGILAYIGLTIVFKEVREIPKIIDKSIFGFVRHPIYLASQLFYLGMILSTLSIFSFIIWIPIFIFHDHIASVEEKKCMNKYGEDYKDYKKRVGKWIPKFIKT
ncbi:MAG: isoprenylcysteine carboxylmethyltransferase family protein [Spirochaetales bacterium]|nr:isoprenylcysteine carboxylmethyltransferase family protein [Spirochaetales bacterium]